MEFAQKCNAFKIGLAISHRNEENHRKGNRSWPGLT